MSATALGACRIGVDIGGTFTDLVCQSSTGATVTRKVASTTHDYSIGIVRAMEGALDELGLGPVSVTEVIHGTTVATNAILEGRGARTALITTAGFRDVLELQRIRIPELYNLFYERPKPLVPRRLRFEVAERMGPAGAVWEPLDGESVRAAAERVARADVEAVAICLLHSYADPSHEQAVADAVRGALPDVFVTCSTEVLNELREYERMSTTVINAYVGPPVRRYLEQLRTRLSGAGVDAPLMVMQCGGGMMTAEAAGQRPAYIVESGPAAGVKAAAALATDAKIDHAITLDMGGTTAKASTVVGGKVALTSEYEVGAGINLSSLLVKGGGYALRIPVVDVSEIGAGGGSVVRVDRAGRLTVGPESAGAIPGPACYGLGGERPTVTDAHVVLGFVNPEQLAGGAVQIRRDLAERAITEQVAEPLGLPMLEAAFGIHALASASMTRAVKAVTTYRGRDPRDFKLIAFGGNGPVVAAQLADDLEITEIVVPPDAGLFSAYGLLRSDLEYVVTRTYLRRAEPNRSSELETDLITLGRGAVAALVGHGYDESQISVSRTVDMRYEEQGYELPVSVPDGRLDADSVRTMIEAFDGEHMRTYGHRAEGEPVDLVTLRVTAHIPADVAAGEGVGRRAAGEAAPQPRRDVYYGPEIGTLATSILRRDEVAADPVMGPVIIEEFDTSTVVPPGALVRVDSQRNLRIWLHER